MTNANPNRPVPRPPIRNIGIADLIRYRLPVPGIVSILHRISGLLMFLSLPLLLWLFDLSLASQTSYAQLVRICGGWFVRLVLLALAWALLHHLCAGLRFLLLDVHLGIERVAARRSSWAVFAVSVPLSLVVALFLFGVL